MNKYPLTGFDKISYEEFCGILEVLNNYSKLSADQKEIIDLLMLGMKKREEIELSKSGEFTKDGFKSFDELKKERSSGQKLDESYQKGDIVKIIADDEYYGLIGKIDEKISDPVRNDLYAVTLSGYKDSIKKIYAGCSLQLIAKGNK